MMAQQTKKKHNDIAVGNYQELLDQVSGRVQIAKLEPEARQPAGVVVLHNSSVKGRSVIEILNSGSGQRRFRTAGAVDEYIQEGRVSCEC